MDIKYLESLGYGIAGAYGKTIEHVSEDPDFDILKPGIDQEYQDQFLDINGNWRPEYGKLGTISPGGFIRRRLKSGLSIAHKVTEE